MIRVCYMVDAPFLGGAERYVSQVALALERDGFAPSVVMRAPDRAGTGLEEWREELDDAGVPVTDIPMQLPGRPWHVARIRAAVAVHAPDVVHVNMPGPYTAQNGLLVPIARLAGAKRVVVTEHLPMVPRLWKRAPIRRAAFRSVDTVVTVSRANVRYLVEEHGVDAGRVRVIHNGLREDFGTDVGSRDHRRAELGLEPGVPTVVFLGNLLRHKGLHRVIEALATHGDIDWRLAVIGAGPEEERCRERARALDVDGRVSFLGRRTPAEVERILPACDALALPSTVEGLPYVILEAMASSLAVVATDVYGIPEMVSDGDTGLLVPPEAPDALSAALRRVVSDRDGTRAMGKRGRVRFEREFTLDRQVSAHEALYREVLER